MRIFKNCSEMIKEIPREIFTRGMNVMDKTVQGKIVTKDEGFEQKELYGVAYTINDLSDKEDMLDIARNYFKKTHLCKEIGDEWINNIFSGNTEYESWWMMDSYTKEYFKKFCNEGTEENPKTSYTYAERIFPQIESVIKRLKENIYARGAYIAVYDSRDVERIGRRIPCTLSMGFSVRNSLEGNKLNLFLHMRSQDAVNFMTLDIYKAIRILEYVAESVEVKVGKLICYVDSLHAYKKDIPENIQW